MGVDMTFSGKVAVIAGGGGIGGATARRLAAGGVAVAIGDLDGGSAEAVAGAIVAQGGQAFGQACDIGNEADVNGLVEAAVVRYGGLDMLHVNAADLQVIFRDSNAVDVDLAVFDRTLAINLRGHLLCTRAAIPRMLARGGGAIVYTSSSAAFIGEAERPCYAMAKAGIHALMRHVASRWGKAGIRANVVAPGFVLTENNLKTMPEEFKALALGKTRSTRTGKPEDIAAMVCLLLADDGEWINGQVISVDGGATMR
ncbi:MAG: SDR family oxidoreductase [Rhodocyclaceae bacterium]|jgi:NAD(P)-dependent dehydrogenase (short-subunit alcohol dehydrogenase family)|nr:SDR family oxidoreductase [Rhodocyclaceae bacterium]MBK6552672.1 SDR family oxidoreductase [Rhodocyclaceae bacterium]MBK7815212.1 SDR family oxidoreductase [Rhodocyclaceae bacterium]MBK9312210.1 SDR family oxidoreductase [Rhodocyclaceae bacterium]